MHGLTVATFLSALSLSSALPSQRVRRDDPTYQCAENVSKPWTVTGFVYRGTYIFTNPAHQNSNGIVNFNLTHPSFGDDAVATCEARSSQLGDFFYGNLRYACAWPEGTGGNFLPESGFNFSYPAKRLDIDQKWICDDYDPEYPSTYWAWGNATLSGLCTDTGTVVNEDWEQGQIYSTRTVLCETPKMDVKVDRIQAIAK